MLKAFKTISFSILASLVLLFAFVPVQTSAQTTEAEVVKAACSRLSPAQTPTEKAVPLLQSGSSGYMVRFAQMQLTQNGYNVKVDGVFGPATSQAVQSFQKDTGLAVNGKPDGKVGPRTWDKLTAGYGNVSCQTNFVERLKLDEKCNIPGGCPDGIPGSEDPLTAPDPGSVGNYCEPGFEYVAPLCIPANPNSAGVASEKNLGDLIRRIITTILILSGVVAVAFIVVGGFLYISSAGNKDMLARGKSILTNALIGLVIVLLAFTIVQVVVSTVTQDKIV